MQQELYMENMVWRSTSNLPNVGQNTEWTSAVRWVGLQRSNYTRAYDTRIV